MKRTTITQIDKIVWIVIEEFTNIYGYAPSLRDIMRIGNVSSTSVVKHSIGKLEKLNILRTVIRTARTIKLLVPFSLRNTVDVPDANRRA